MHFRRQTITQPTMPTNITFRRLITKIPNLNRNPQLVLSSRRLRQYLQIFVLLFAASCGEKEILVKHISPTPDQYYRPQQQYPRAAQQPYPNQNPYYYQQQVVPGSRFYSNPYQQQVVPGSRFYSNPYDLEPPPSYGQYNDFDQYYVPPAGSNNVEPQYQQNPNGSNGVLFDR
jgi:hypothetical protein